MTRIEVLSGVERRRRWSTEEKRRLVSAAFAPGVVVSDVARQADIHPNQLYRWRQELRSSAGGFAEVILSGALPTPGAADMLSGGEPPVIEVGLADGARLRLPVSVSPDLAAAVIGALVRRPLCDRRGEGR